MTSGDDGWLIAGEDGVHLTVFRETSTLELGEHELTVLAHLKASAVARGERHRIDSILVLVEQLLRQTDGSRLVVSDRAIDQFDLQDLLL